MFSPFALVENVFLSQLFLKITVGGKEKSMVMSDWPVFRMRVSCYTVLWSPCVHTHKQGLIGYCLSV